MNLRTPRKITVSTVAVNLRAGSGIGYPPSRSLIVYGAVGDSVGLYLGKTSGLTTAADSFPVTAGVTFAVPDGTGNLWAISDGTVVVYIWDAEE